MYTDIVMNKPDLKYILCVTLQFSDKIIFKGVSWECKCGKTYSNSTMNVPVLRKKKN